MFTNKTTLVVGASLNPQRYSNMAVNMLLEHQISTFAFGKKEGKIKQILIETDFSKFIPLQLNTITLYLNPENQKPLIQSIINLKPERVIFNPGTENEDFEDLLAINNIEVLEACTLVLLRTSQY